MNKHSVTMSVKKTKKNILITASNGFRWETDSNLVEVAVTNVLAHTVVRAFDFAKTFSAQFTIELKVTQKDEEREKT